MAHPQSDRRAFARIPVRFDVLYNLPGQEERFTGQAIDLGQGGLALIGEKRFPEGLEIEVRLRNLGESQDLLVTRAIVRYSEENKLRVQFLEARDPDQIERLVQKQR